jgi:hypothetical protein
MIVETKKIPLIHNFAQFFEKARLNMFPALKKLSQQELHLNFETSNNQEEVTLLPPNTRFQTNLGKVHIDKGTLYLKFLPMDELKANTEAKFFSIQVFVYTQSRISDNT